MLTEAVIFDLDDTLLVEVASADAAFLATCALADEKYGIDTEELHQTVRSKARELWHASPARGYCVDIGISSWEGLWARFQGDDPNLETLRAWAPTYRLESWSRALAEHGVNDPSFAEQLADTFRKERRARHIVYADVTPTLEEVGQTHRLALLTNGAADLQREKIRESQLAPFFEVIVISGEVGVRKPEPEIFKLVLERLRAAPETAVMVGNSLGSDVAGAQRAGLKGVWLNRSGKQRDDGVEPDAEIASLSGLKGIL
jgi:putative hydrolase of the HAD superfamily